VRPYRLVSLYLIVTFILVIGAERLSAPVSPEAQMDFPNGF
jgi:hypothetical protein